LKTGKIMADPYSHKSSVEDIRRRFDQDVERFSNLAVGINTTVDAALALELVAASAAAVCPQARAVLDIGCGAGNYTLKLLQQLSNLDVTLVDLSRPMLERAVQRIQPVIGGQVDTLQGDVRLLELGSERFDIIFAGAVFHHLRGDEEWQAVFAKCLRTLRPGGGLFIFDLVEHQHSAVQALFWARYGDYLSGLRDPAFRDQVFTYIQQEDTPRSLFYQLDLLARTGFRFVDVLHKNNCFAAFYAVR
jgi:tRNA (cmo5U34)-methyltransferase